MKRRKAKETDFENNIQHSPYYFVVSTILKFLACYGFASWGIERGNLILYFITLGFLGSGIKSFLLFIKSLSGVVHG